MRVKADKLRGTAERFVAFHEEFSRFFQTKTRDNSEVAGHYLKGLVQTPKRNMERMEEKVPESNGQALQHFITNSPWDDRAVVTQVSKEGDKILGGSEDSCLLIDETSFAKKGDKSVGVSRQYSGRAGKVDNCQVAVFGALACKDKSLPIDFRLYLPESWTGNTARCLAAGIPREKIVHKTKCQQAIDIVNTALENGLRFSWVGADAGYGRDRGFFRDLFAVDVDFVIDVHKNQTIFFGDPALEDNKSIPVEKWMAKQPEASWITISPRNSTKGKLLFDYLHANVWIKTSDDTSREVQLIVRRSHQEKNDFKFSIAYVKQPVSLERLAYMQGQRFWIERAFEDSKGSLGMSDYQMRKWRGWHHHMALVMMAHLFLLRERIHNEEDYPLLSMQDVVTMLTHYLPKRDVDEEEVFRQLEARHDKRQRDIDRGES